MRKIFVWAATAAVALGMGVVALPKEVQTESASAATIYFEDDFSSYSSYGTSLGGRGSRSQLSYRWANQYFDGVGDGTADQSCTDKEIEVVNVNGNKMLYLKTAQTAQSFFYLSPRDTDGSLLVLEDYEFSFDFKLDPSSNMTGYVNSSTAPWLAVLNRKTLQNDDGEYVPADGRFNGTNSIMASVRAGYREGEPDGTIPYYFSELNRVNLSTMGNITEQNETRTGTASDITSMDLYAWHTYKVKIVGAEVDLYVDGVHLGGYTIPLTGPNKMFHKEGAVSIACCVWDGYIDNVKITEASNLKTFSIAAENNYPNAGIITGAKNYTEGESFTLTATPHANEAEQHYTFDGWYEKGGSKRLDEATPGTFTDIAKKNVTYEARWTPKMYTITFSKNLGDAGDIIVNGNPVTSGQYAYGSKITATVTTNFGYTFLGWDSPSTEENPSTKKEITVQGPATYEAHWKSNNVTIKAEKNIAEAGTIEIDGLKETDEGFSDGKTVSYDSEMTLKATTNIGFTFLGWYDGATQVCAEETFTFHARQFKTYEARWEIKKINITLINLNTKAGSVAGAGSFNYNTERTIKATANEGFTFVKWHYKDANGVEKEFTDDTITIGPLTVDVTLTVKWFVPKYPVTATSNIAEAGEVAGGGEIDLLESVTLTATTISEDYYFDGWYNGEVKVFDEPKYTFQVKGKTDLQARWIKKAVLTVNTNVDVEGDEVNLTKGKYELGSEVVLEAYTLAGYRFVGWYQGTELLSTRNIYSFPISEDMEVEARWVKTYVVTLDKNYATGVLDGAGTYDVGTEVTISARIVGKFTFIAWKYADDTVASESAEYKFTLEADITLKAEWESSVPAFNITVVAAEYEGNNVGTVQGAGKYQQGQKVTLVAENNLGYAFDGWYTEGGEKVSSASVYEFMAEAHVSLVAKWKVKYVTVYFDTGVSALQPITIVEGETVEEPDVTLEKVGYEFLGWYVGEVAFDFDAPILDSVVITAKWEIKEYTLTIVYGNGEENTVITQQYDSEIDAVVAPVKPGYTFLGWDNIIPSKMPAQDMTVTALWVKNSYTVSVAQNITEAGSVTGAGKYDEGASVQLTATTYAGYAFVGWYVGTEQVSPNATYVINNIAENKTIEAKWQKVVSSSERDIPVVSVKLGSEAAVSIAPNVSIESFKYGEDVDVPNNGYSQEVATGRITFTSSFIMVLGEGVHHFTLVSSDSNSTTTYNIAIEVTKFDMEVVEKKAKAGSNTTIALKNGATITGVSKGGVALATNAYSDKGNGKLVLEGAYLMDLGAGEHELTVETNLGTFLVKLSVTVPEETDGAGCSNSVGLSSAVTMLGLAGAALVASKKRKK